MSSQLEAEKSKVLKKALRQLGAYAVKIVGHSKQESGLPDVFVCWKGRFIGIEMKIIDKPTHKMPYTGVQYNQLKLIRASAGIGIGMCWCPALKLWGVDWKLKWYVAENDWYTLRDALEELNQRL